MIRVNDLVSDELDWELRTRAIDPSNHKVDEKRKLLRAQLNIERYDANKISSYTRVELDVVTELEFCSNRVAELSDSVRCFEEKPLTTEFKRLETKLNHIYRRLSYISEVVGEEFKTTWKMARDGCLQLLESLSEVGESDVMHQNDLFSLMEQSQIQLGNSNANEEILHVVPTSSSGNSVTQALAHSVLVSSADVPFSSTVPTANANPEPTTCLTSGLGRITFADVVSTSTDTYTFSAQQPRFSLAHLTHSSPHLPNRRVDFDTSAAAGRFSNRLRDLELSQGLNCASYSLGCPVSVSKWNLKFSGNTATQGVNSFLERVEELRVARNLSYDQLFNEAVDLFEDQALIWFRSIRGKVSTWRDIVGLLRRHYLPRDYDDALWTEIRARIQGVDERPHIYIAIMTNLFNRLSNTPSEDIQLKYIRQNLHPYYTSHLALIRISSIDVLIEYCRELEETRDRNKKFRPNFTASNFPLEPDLAYKPTHSVKRQVHTISKSCTNFQQSVSPNNVRFKTKSFSRGSTNLTCWNCHEKGHTYHKCDKERTLFCYVCGIPNATFSTCPKCKGNVSKNAQGQVSSSATQP